MHFDSFAFDLAADSTGDCIAHTLALVDGDSKQVLRFGCFTFDLSVNGQLLNLPRLGSHWGIPCSTRSRVLGVRHTD